MNFGNFEMGMGKKNLTNGKQVWMYTKAGLSAKQKKL